MKTERCITGKTLSEWYNLGMSETSPKKSLGQHWLRDGATLQAMADAADVVAGDVVLEIGPGLGTLTEVLLAAGAKVIAVEFDDLLAAGLRAKGWKNLEVMTADILSYDLTTLPKGYKVVANIPYYLTNKLLRTLCESSNPPVQMALLVQKEVAERVAAAPGDMSLLSVSVQFYCEVGLGQVAPAKLFTPPPKVDSQILQLAHRPQLLYDVDTKQFFGLVKAGFSQRRKKLRSSLSGGLRISKPEASDLIEKAGLNPDVRAQELSLDNWYQLHQANTSSN